MNQQFIGTKPISENLFDRDKLEDFLKKNVHDFSGNLKIEQFKGGQSNPTFKITADEKNYVIRRKPPGKLLPSAHAVDREYKVISALRDTSVPVPKAYCLCEDESIIGTMFYVMDFVDGIVLWDQTLPGYSQKQREKIYQQMNYVISELHKVDYKKIGLEDYGKPGNYISRQISRWTKQYRASETEKIESMENLMNWLPENIPDDEMVSIVHGDFRMDNLVFNKAGTEILAVLDWELSTLGHPLADFAYHCMYWRLTAQEFRGIKGEDLVSLGIPFENNYVDMYCKSIGINSIDNWDFYMAYNMFRLAGILQGIMGRVVDGTATSAHALEQGKKAKLMADAGWEQVKKIKGAL